MESWISNGGRKPVSRAFWAEKLDSLKNFFTPDSADGEFLPGYFCQEIEAGTAE